MANGRRGVDPFRAAPHRWPKPRACSPAATGRCSPAVPTSILRTSAEADRAEAARHHRLAGLRGIRARRPRLDDRRARPPGATSSRADLPPCSTRSRRPRARSAACRSRTPAPWPATSATPRRRPTACRRCSRSAPRSSCRARAGARRCRSQDFVTGSRRTARATTELVTRVQVPGARRGARSTFLKLGGRRYLVISITMVAVLIERRRTTAARPCGVAVGAARRWRSASGARGAASSGRRWPGSPACVAPDDLAPLTPIDDVRASARLPARRDADRCSAGAARSCRAMTRARSASAADRRLQRQRHDARAVGDAGAPARRMCCATSSASPAPRSAATPAIAAPVRCCSTASRSAPASSPSASAPAARSRRSRGWRAGGDAVAAAASFIAHGAAQCGICTPGMLMAAADAAARASRADREPRCSTALAGVLCRCTGYRKIVEAVLAAAAGAAERAAEPPRAARSARGWPGSTASAKVHRRRRFGADTAPASALAARRSARRTPRARFSLGDLAAFRALHPGLVDVLTRGVTCRTTASRSSRPARPAGARRRRRPVPRRGGAGARRRRGGAGDRRGASCRSRWQPQRSAGMDAALAAGAAAPRARPRQRAVPRPGRARQRRCRAARGAVPGAAHVRRPASSSTPTSSRRPGYADVSVDGAATDPRLRVHADALHGPRRGRARDGVEPDPGAHRAFGDRRRLRRQARHLGPAAAGGRRVEVRPAVRMSTSGPSRCCRPPSAIRRR